jgi:hypothetical protein
LLDRERMLVVVGRDRSRRVVGHALMIARSEKLRVPVIPSRGARALYKFLRSRESHLKV